MIELQLNTALLLYLTSALIGLGLVWLFQGRRKQKEHLTLHHQLLTCEYCKQHYLEDTLRKVTQCPHCSSFNAHNPYKP